MCMQAQFILPVKGITAAAKRDELAMLNTNTVDNKLEVSGNDMKITFDLERDAWSLSFINRKPHHKRSRT